MTHKQTLALFAAVGLFAGAAFALGRTTAHIEAAVAPSLADRPARESASSFIDVDQVFRWTDPETGCEYIGRRNDGALVLRLHNDGMPYCKDGWEDGTAGEGQEGEEVLPEPAEESAQITPYVPGIDGPVVDQAQPTLVRTAWVF